MRDSSGCVDHASLRYLCAPAMGFCNRAVSTCGYIALFTSVLGGCSSFSRGVGNSVSCARLSRGIIEYSFVGRIRAGNGCGRCRSCLMFREDDSN